MSKILVVGTGPLYSPEVKTFCSQSLRTWHLTRPLRDAGHAVELVVLPTDGFSTDAPPGTVTTARYDTFNYQVINSFAPDQVIPALQKVVDSGNFDCIVAVNVNAAAIVSRLHTRLPLWIDLFGHMMGEAQTKCQVENDDRFLQHFWSRQRTCLRRGDRFSVSGHKQMYAVLGELGALGRLGKLNCTHPFCSVIPITPAEHFLNMDLQFAEKHFRGPVFPEDSFAVVWTGGYNTWTDIKTLAAALTLAMEQVPRMRFVSTGGIVPGHDEVTYPAFLEEMRRSGFEDRCHFLGWIEGGELPYLYAESDLGLSLDGLNYETLLGGRCRLINLMAAGVPVLTTLGTEISELIADNRLGYTVKIGKVQEFADAIYRASRNPLERRQLANRARTYCREHLTYDATTRSLLKWVAEPARSPDNEQKVQDYPKVPNPAHVALNGLEAEALFLENNGMAEIEKLRQEVAEFRGSRLIKLRDKIRGVKVGGAA